MGLKKIIAASALTAILSAGCSTEDYFGNREIDKTPWKIQEVAGSYWSAHTQRTVPELYEFYTPDGERIRERGIYSINYELEKQKKLYREKQEKIEQERKRLERRREQRRKERERERRQTYLSKIEDILEEPGFEEYYKLKEGKKDTGLEKKAKRLDMPYKKMRSIKLKKIESENNSFSEKYSRLLRYKDIISSD